MVLGYDDGLDDSACPPIALPSNAFISKLSGSSQASDISQTFRGCGIGNEGRSGDGFQSPQDRYFDPVIDNAGGLSAAAQPFRLPAAAVSPAVESNQGGESASGASYSATDNWALNQFGAGSSCESSPFAPAVVQYVPQFVPCMPVLIPARLAGCGMFGWPGMMLGPPNPRASNRTMKRGFGRDMNMSLGDPRNEKSALSAKAKSRPLSSVAFGKKRGAQAAPPVEVKVPENPEKTLERPSAVFIDLSCLSLRPPGRKPGRSSNRVE